MLEKARQAERLTAERSAAQERYERYRQAVAVSEELAGLQGQPPLDRPAARPAARASNACAASTRRIRELRAALSGEVEVSFEVAPAPTWRPLSRVAVILVVVGIIVAVLGAASKALEILDIGDLPIYLGLAVAGLGLILAIGRLLAATPGPACPRRCAMSRSTDGSAAGRRWRPSSRPPSSRRSSSSGSSARPSSRRSRTCWPARRSTSGGSTSSRRSSKGLVGKEPVETLPGLRDAAALEIEQKGHALEQLGPIAREPRARERLEVEVRDQEVALERSRDDEANARARVEANTVDAEQIAALAEQLAGWREQLAALQRRARIYETTLRGIEQRRAGDDAQGDPLSREADGR